MVSQDQNRQKVAQFGMTKEPETKPDTLTEAELALLNEERQLAAKRQEIETKRREQQEQQRLTDIREYERLKTLAVGWRTQAGKETDKEVSAQKILWAEEVELAVSELAQKLGYDQEVEAKPKAKPMINTNVALGILIGLFVVCAVLTKVIGNLTMQHYPNDTTLMLIANSPLRIMLSFTVVFLSFLVSALIIRLFLTPIYRLWHSRTPSARSFQDVVNDAPAWAVLFAVLSSFFGVMYLFVTIYTSLFA